MKNEIFINGNMEFIKHFSDLINENTKNENNKPKIKYKCIIDFGIN